MRFRIPTVLSCSVPSAAGTLPRAGGILNCAESIYRRGMAEAIIEHLDNVIQIIQTIKILHKSIASLYS